MTSAATQNINSTPMQLKIGLTDGLKAYLLSNVASRQLYNTTQTTLTQQTCSSYHLPNFSIPLQSFVILQHLTHRLSLISTPALLLHYELTTICSLQSIINLHSVLAQRVCKLFGRMVQQATPSDSAGCASRATISSQTHSNWPCHVQPYMRYAASLQLQPGHTLSTQCNIRSHMYRHAHVQGFHNLVSQQNSLLQPQIAATPRQRQSIPFYIQKRNYIRQKSTEPAWRSHEWTISRKLAYQLLQVLPRAFNVYRFDVLPRNTSNAKLTLRIKHASSVKGLYWVLRIHGMVFNHMHWAQYIQKLERVSVYSPTLKGEQCIRFLRNVSCNAIEANLQYMPPDHIVQLLQELVSRQVQGSPRLFSSIVNSLNTAVAKLSREQLVIALSCLAKLRYQDWPLIGSLCREFLFKVGGTPEQNYPPGQQSNLNYDSQLDANRQSDPSRLETSEHGVQPFVQYHLAKAPLNLSVSLQEVLDVTAALATFTPYVYVPVEVTNVDRHHVAVHVSINGRTHAIQLPYIPGFFVNKDWVPHFCEAQAAIHALGNHSVALMTSGAVQEVDTHVVINYVAALARAGALRPDLLLLFRRVLADVDLSQQNPQDLQTLYLAGLTQQEQMRERGVEGSGWGVVSEHQWKQLCNLAPVLSSSYMRSKQSIKVLKILRRCAFDLLVERSVDGHFKTCDFLLYGVGSGSLAKKITILQETLQQQQSKVHREQEADVHLNQQEQQQQQEAQREQENIQQESAGLSEMHAYEQKQEVVPGIKDSSQNWQLQNSNSSQQNDHSQNIEGDGECQSHSDPKQVGGFISSIYDDIIAVEVDGTMSWSSDDSRAPLSTTLWSHRLLLRTGVPIARIPAFEMNNVGWEERKGYVLNRIAQALQLT